METPLASSVPVAFRLQFTAENRRPDVEGLEGSYRRGLRRLVRNVSDCHGCHGGALGR